VPGKFEMSAQLQTNPEYERLVPPLTNDEYKQLRESIKKNGQWVPIIVNKDNVILDGYHRYRACFELRIDPRFTHQIFDSNLLEKKFVIECNLKRRHLNDFQKAELGIPLLAIEKELAKLRQGKRNDLTSVSNDAEVKPIKATTQLSKKIGLSTRTFERAKKVIETAPEELKERVRSGQTSINYAYKTVTRIEKKKESKPIPQGQFSVILVDPPLEYNINIRGSPDAHYDVMTLESICKMKIPSAKNCMLFLWATASNLIQAFQVLEAWGFIYKTHLIWVKDKIGTGHYFRGQHELLLLGRKGNISVPEEKDRPSSVLHAPRTTHSKKPEQVHTIIERMYPKQKYLELFARQTRKDWETWGNDEKLKLEPLEAFSN